MMEKCRSLIYTVAIKLLIKLSIQMILKKNCVLVFASFFIRKGLINFKNEKNYEEICRFL